MRRFWGIVYLGLVVADVVPPILVGTAWNALQLGVSIIAIGKWRTERGIWMLASLFAAIDAWLLAMFTWGIGRDLLRGTAYPPLIALDSALSLALLATTAFLLVCVARWNWRLTRPPRLPPSWPDAGSRVRGPVRPNQPPSPPRHARLRDDESEAVGCRVGCGTLGRRSVVAPEATPARARNSA